jgi:hypothetical protein
MCFIMKGSWVRENSIIRTARPMLEPHPHASVLGPPDHLVDDREDQEAAVP